MIVISKKVELIKEMSYFELEQKEKINNRITIPLAIITILIGLAVFYFKGLEHIETNVWGYTFFAIYGIYVMLIVASIVLLFRAYYDYKYSYLPSPQEVEKDMVEIEKYYDDNYQQYFQSKGTKEELLEKDIERIIHSYYLKATKKNIPMNERKFKLLRYAGKTLFYAVFFAALSIIPYQISFEENKVVKVEIDQLESIINMNNKGENE